MLVQIGTNYETKNGRKKIRENPFSRICGSKVTLPSHPQYKVSNFLGDYGKTILKFVVQIGTNYGTKNSKRKKLSRVCGAKVTLPQKKRFWRPNHKISIFLWK